MLSKLSDADATKELVSGFLTPIFQQAAEEASSDLGDPLESMRNAGIATIRDLTSTVKTLAADFVDQLKSRTLELSGRAWDAVTRPLDILKTEIQKFEQKFLADIEKVIVSMLLTAYCLLLSTLMLTAFSILHAADCSPLTTYCSLLAS